ncbi:MAG TPA: hypothetical protein PKJ08_03515 [Candidatus Cloacimonadota bacterium]|nr:hypothetical protein [Candidatus Cloacimonadota bacterium]
MKVIMKENQHDFPKKIGDLSLAWYQQGRICVSRKQNPRSLQKQNINLIQINQITKTLWQTLHPHFKKDMALYALQYKKKYPGLRKRGISSYAVFLMIIHALIKRFSIAYENQDVGLAILKNLISVLSVKKAVQLKLLKIVRDDYQLNHEATLYSAKNDYQSGDIVMPAQISGQCVLQDAYG